MAEHLASIFGTEKDRVNCPFYFKIGACRHGDRCSRLHNKPTISQTILCPNMYQNPVLNAPPGPDGLPQQIDARAAQQHFEEFYEDVFEELAQFGEIENLNICDNFADHMVGNVYVKFKEEEAAARAMQALMGRYYDKRLIVVEFSPVTDFREATCRQYEENTCNRGGYCNFMHLKPIAKDLRKKLFGRYRGGGGTERKRSRSRSRSPKRSGRDERGRDSDRDRRRERSRSRERSGRGRSPTRDERDARKRERESSEERRAKIAAWNKEREPEPAAPLPQPPQPYGDPVAANGAGGYSLAPASYNGGGYDSQQHQQQQLQYQQQYQQQQQPQPPQYNGGVGGY